MKFRKITVLAAAVAVLASSAIAQQQLTPEQQLDARTRVETAVALVEIAKAESDGDALLVAARLLSSVDRVAMRGTEGQQSTGFYSVAELAAQAKQMGADAAKADELATSATASREICYWEFKCGTFECDWVYVCEY